jgi:transcriptional regulator with XRE-family HTH domain
MTFGEKLKQLRISRNKTQTNVANAVGISRQRISFYEIGVNIPNIEILYRLCEYFNVSADYMLGLPNDADAVIQAAVRAERENIYHEMLESLMKWRQHNEI